MNTTAGCQEEALSADDSRCRLETMLAVLMCLVCERFELTVAELKSIIECKEDKMVSQNSAKNCIRDHSGASEDRLQRKWQAFVKRCHDRPFYNASDVLRFLGYIK